MTNHHPDPATDAMRAVQSAATAGFVLGVALCLLVAALAAPLVWHTAAQIEARVQMMEGR